MKFECEQYVCLGECEDRTIDEIATGAATAPIRKRLVRSVCEVLSQVLKEGGKWLTIVGTPCWAKAKSVATTSFRLISVKTLSMCKGPTIVEFD